MSLAEHWCRLNTVRQLAEWFLEKGEPIPAEEAIAFARDQGWLPEEDVD